MLDNVSSVAIYSVSLTHLLLPEIIYFEGELQIITDNIFAAHSWNRKYMYENIILELPRFHMIKIYW